MVLLFLGLLGGLFHVGHAQVQRFENSAAQDIASRLQGEHRQVSIRADVGPEAMWGDIHAVQIDASHFSTSNLPLYTESKRSHRGLVRQLHFDLQDFSLRDLHIERLSADIPGCRFDFPLAVNHRKIRLSQSGIGEGEVVVSEHDLEQFILSKFPEIRRVTVKIDKDKVFVDGFGVFLIFSTDFSVVARLEAPDGDKLVLTYARILLDGRPADEQARNAILDTLNPVVDLNKDLGLLGAIKVAHVTLRNGALTAEGQITIPEQPHEK